MKTYWTARELRIVGKAYEVRWKLRRLVRDAANPHQPLAQLLRTKAGGNR